MSKFKPGDKVRYIEESGLLKKGRVYTVARRHADGDEDGIELVEDVLPGRGYTPWWYESRFELVTTSYIDEEIEKVQADKAAAKNRLFDLRLLRSLANDNGYTLTKEA